MQLQIQVIKVKDKFFPSAKGGYSMLEVTYQNLSQGGKTEGKKLFSFGDYAAVYEAAKEWKEDQVVSVQNEKVYSKKDDRDYWTWVAVVEGGDTATEAVVENKKEATVVDKKAEATPTKQQWVPDEVKQRLIVGQTSIEHAIAFEAGNSATVDDVLVTAQRFYDFVFSHTESKTAAVEVPKKAGRPKKEVADSEVE